MPDASSTVAFKEWSAVCHALGGGRQTLILRKGGIHEGRTGFEFKHDGFVLFPTRFHEQDQHVRSGELPAGWDTGLGEYQVGDPVEIEFRASLAGVWTVTEWENIAALEPFHIWDEATIRDRFEWAQSEGDPPALNVALVKIYRLSKPWEFAYERGHGGCRSWLDLSPVPEDLVAGASPVLADDAFEALRAGVESILGSPLAG